MLGYDRIPLKWKKHIPDIADSTFIYTNYSFNKAVDGTLAYAKQLIVKNGGKIEGDVCHVKIQKPKPPKLEQSFPNLKATYRTTILDQEGWNWKGGWKDIEHYQWGTSELQKVAERKDSEFTFTFNGTGVVIMGRWDRDGGKADVYVDDKFIKEIDNYYWVMDRGAGFHWLNAAHLFHILELSPEEHSIRIVVNGKKNEKSTGTKLRVSRAIVYQ